MSEGFLRRFVARGALGLFFLAAFWGTSLFLLGGVELHWFGKTISSHEPMRPLLIAALTLAIFMLAGGDDVVTRRVFSVDAWFMRAPASAKARLCALVVAALVTAVVAGGIVFGSKVVGGSDSWGYVSQVELFVKGQLRVSQPWVQDVPWPDALVSFTPLGYNPAPLPSFSLAGYTPSHDPLAIVPAYSPGLPMLMAAAKFVGGNSAVFVVVPICGGLLVLATYGVGRRLGSRWLGTIAAFLVATSPPFLEYAWSPMTDVPASAGWMLAWWGVLGRTMRSAWAGGVALAIVILVRPERVPLAATIVLWLCVSIWRHPRERGLHLRRAVVILGGLAVGMLSVAVLYWHLYGSPLQSGYGGASQQFALRYFLSNLGKYTRVFANNQTPLALLGIVALLFPLRRLWPTVSDRSVVCVLALFSFLVWAEYCLIVTNEAWERFLLPSYGPIMIGMAAVFLYAARLGRGARLGVAIVLVTLGMLGVQGIRDRWSYVPSREARYLAFMERARQLTAENSVVMAMQHSGSIRYYAGRETLRFDQLPPDWLDRSLAWISEHGVHSYAVLDDWELDELRKQFAGQALLSKFEKPVMRVDTMALYDLGLAEAPVTTDVLTGPFRSRFGLSPAPQPTLVWKR